MKELRHAKIKEILEDTIILTQEELTEKLLEYGIKATQATVSRDIKELMLIKVPIGDGRYRYAFGVEQNTISQCRLERSFQDALVSINYSGNIIVLKTLPGTAQALGYNIDYLKWPEILGTVAGDDTIFVLVKSEGMIQKVIDNFNNLLKRKSNG